VDHAFRRDIKNTFLLFIAVKTHPAGASYIYIYKYIGVREPVSFFPARRSSGSKVRISDKSISARVRPGKASGDTLTVRQLAGGYQRGIKQKLINVYDTHIPRRRNVRVPSVDPQEFPRPSFRRPRHTRTCLRPTKFVVRLPVSDCSTVRGDLADA